MDGCHPSDEQPHLSLTPADVDFVHIMPAHKTEPRRRLTLILRAMFGREYWWWSLLGIAGSVQIAATVRALLRPFPLALGSDAAVFQHGGWYITQGAILYIDIWDPMPPLTFFIPTLLALRANEDMLVLHILSMVATGVAAVIIVLLIGHLTVEISRVPWTGPFAGLVMLTFVSFYILPTLGISVKHYSMLFGLLSLHLALRDRLFMSGITAAASPLFWLLGAIFPLLVLSIIWNRKKCRAMLKAVAGMAIITSVTMLPILYWGAFGAMFQEVIMAPLLASEDLSFVDRLEKGARFLLFTTPFVFIAPLGVLCRLRQQSSLWWVASGGIFYYFILLFFDFDNFPDLIPALIFVSIGVGAIVANATFPIRSVLFLFWAVALILNPVIHYLSPDAIDSSAKLVGIRGIQGYMVPSMQAIYWNKVRPETCHYRLSVTEQAWIARMRALGREECPIGR